MRVLISETRRFESAKTMRHCAVEQSPNEPGAGSAIVSDELRCNLGGDEVEVIEIGQIEDLHVEPVDPGLL